ncbi:hypothetical protein [Nostoc sp. 'Peltigera membranacea cyanobiont' N6]|uniref:hypothetical protein n=1 Tax=Nostoc sp. 'Peltigera membranacea cyanobiont' N6 TaxID=1261031 RepID=UPI000D0BF1CC|nr:hypothetical protein [Nostoc sp. 'Peltigera membranacea cyanobiont' N6]AVH68284.1 hypothetical protein NPM_100010 [Nostoc sp. 'Peltigera membranacea cyanobiont' N6]
MVARKKSTVTADTISIHDACLKYMTTEQSLRLALSSVRPDDFDTVKAISEADLEAIASNFQPKLPSNTLELAENLQNSTQQEPDQVSESNLQVSKPTQNLTSPTQSTNAQLSLIEQLTKQAEQEIQLVDAISQVKNQIILNNLAVRESELTEQVNQRWLNQKQGYLGSIRGLADLAQQKPEVSTDDTNLTQEIDQILGDLEKKLIV